MWAVVALFIWNELKDFSSAIKDVNSVLAFYIESLVRIV